MMLLKVLFSEEHVGLPEGVIGSFEVGHSTIFCGKPYPEMLPDINEALKDCITYLSDAWKKIIARNECTTHFLGLLSGGQVHYYKINLALL